VTGSERRLRFDADYEERCRVADGTLVRLRLVRPEDKPLLLEGWSRLSPESRYRRFLTAKDHLTERELVRLTEMDGNNDLAIGAMAEIGGKEVGIGIARFVRLRDRPNIAEAALVVVDDMQRKGLGTLLLRCLRDAAVERGIDAFACELLASNTGARALLGSIAPNVIEHPEGITLSAEVPLTDRPSTDPQESPGVLQQMLRSIARGTFQLARALEELGERVAPHSE
jgi:GNAT superfamily N-acetyltransferase